MKKKCGKCDGSGEIVIWTSSAGSPVVSWPCRECKGTGEATPTKGPSGER